MHRKMLSYFFALAFATGAFLAHAETYTATNVVVAPLTDAHWTQGAPYNDYSPKGTTVFTSGWEAGCVATAAAQELYYWQWPWRLDAVHETSHPVLNESNLSLRFDGNVPFDWESMQNSYGDGATLKQKHAAARLVLACQSLVQMQFVSAGGSASKNLPGTMEWFEYAGQVTPRASDTNLAALQADMEFGSPVQTGINFKGYGGHEVVGLGYATGTNTVGDAKNLIWLNLGWGGGSDGWYDLAEATEGETIIKSVQLGFRPIKSVQIEPVAPVSGNSVTLNWHLPNCYTNKITGFTVEKKKLATATTTWSDDFSTAKGRSSNTNEVRIVNGALKAWDGTASGMYIWDEVFEPTADSILSYDVGSSYMNGMSVRFEAKVDGVWQSFHAVNVNGGKEINYYNWGTTTAADPVSLASLAGKKIQLRFVVEYTTGGIFTSDDASMKIDNLSVSNVMTFETVSTDSTIAASARSTTFSGLTTGDTYAFTVAPVMSDGTPAVVQTVTTTIGTPAATPTINAVTMSPRGSDLVQEGFYADIAMGWNIIDVACSESVTSLEAFISHQSVLPQSKIEVVNNGNGSFSINIDASGVAAKWANQKMILTLKATNATGESVYKDVELCLKASGVPENVPGGKVWTGASAMFGAEDYTAKWSGGVLPVNGDKVTFLTTDDEFGGEMNLNLSTPTTLGYVHATGDGQLTISGTSSEMLTANVLKNDIQVEVNSSKFKVNKAVPSANIVIDGGSCLDCEIDQSRSGYIKKVSGGYVSALTDSSLWKGTVVFSGYTAKELNFSSYGNNSSFVRLNSVSGYLAYNTTFNPMVELVDSGTTPALDWNNGSGSSTATFKGISGDGTFKTSGTGGTAEKIIINDIDGFTGSFNLASKVVAIGTSIGTTASNGRLNVNSGKSATIAGGKTWTIGGGVYLAGTQTLTVNGTLSDSGALAAEGTGTVLDIAPTGSVSAASLSFANNTIRLSMTQDASSALTVTGAANLAGATIDVDRVSGMPVENSIALMTAGSFAGVDTATISGLDGYSMEADGGTLYAVKDEPIYDGPAPTAVWVSGEFEDDASEHGGYSIVLPSSGISVSGGNLVVASDATTGATIDLSSASTNKVTVLIEYSSLAAVSSKNVTLATVKDSDSHVIGARTTENGALTLTGYYDASSDNDYAFGTEPTVPVGTGYLMFMYDNTTDNNINGTYCYAGDSIDALVGGRRDNLKWTGGTKKINAVSIGGPITANRVKAWSGVKVEKVALFVGEALTNSDIANYKFPEPTVVARFVNGGDSTDYGSLNDALTALAMALFSNPNSTAYVEVVDDGLEAPNEYGASNIGYSEAERKYARSVAKIDNGTATYPAFLNLADAWVAAGKGADTAIITILANPTDSVTIEVGQTLKVDGLALADDKVLVGENRIKHVATDNGIAIYTATYTDAVTLLDGTIYRGNDANRAVITNYLSQMVGHRPVKMPAPNTVDLLLVYDPNAVAYATNHYSSVEEHAAHNVAVMNQALTTTDIDTNVWFRIAGIYQVDVAADNVDDALDRLNGKVSGWEQVASERERVGADVVLGVVYSKSNYGLANWCSPSAIMNGSAAGSAKAGVRADAAWAWVHEVGHTASLFHNPVEAAGKYHDTTSIGCGFVKTAAADAAELRSLMDSGTVQMAFSSPNHMSHGEVYSVTNASGAWVDSSGELARLLPYMAQYRDTVVNAWTITPKSGSTVTAGDTMTVTCEDPEATIWYSRDGLSETQYTGPISIDTSSFICSYIVNIKKDDETVGTTYVAYTVDQPQTDPVAKIGETPYDSLAEAVNAATASSAESVEISLLQASSDAVTLDAKTTVTEASSGLYTGTLSGSGTLVLAGTRSAALSFNGWTGTVEVPQITSGKVELKFYGVEGSTVCLGEGMSGGWLANETVNPAVEIPDGQTLTLSAFSPSFANTIKKLKGAGTLEFTYSDAIDLSQSSFSPYFLIQDVSQFTGKLSTAKPSIVVGASAKPAKNTSLYPGRIAVYGDVTASSDWSASQGIVLADAAATLTVKDGVTVTTEPAVSTTVADSYVMKVTAVEGGTQYVVRSLADRTTNTDYPVPYSWFSEYYPGIEDYPDMVETFAKMSAENGQNTWWQCYVLGLEPTNETSKFTISIRMEGTTPIVEYSPTNDTLVASGAIEYVLQGKPALTNGWQDVEFDEPGDTNRFFRVKVKW